VKLAGKVTLPAPSKWTPTRSPSAKLGANWLATNSARPSREARALSASKPANGPWPKTVLSIANTSNRLKKVSRRLGR
jgi:hypothetical protein